MRNQHVATSVALLATIVLIYPWQGTSAESVEKPTNNRFNIETKTTAPSPDATTIREGINRVAKELEEERKKPETAVETRRLEGDLKAQQDSARWAMVMAFCALVTTCVGLPGLYFLWRTVQYTKLAAESAKNTLHSTRAWMTFSKLSFLGDGSDLDQDGYCRKGYRMHLVWKNCGASPAINTIIVNSKPLVIDTSPTDDDPAPIELEGKAEGGSAMVGPNSECQSPPILISYAEFQAIISNKKSLFVRNLIEYRDIFHSNTVRFTDTTMRIFILKSADGRLLLTWRAVGTQDYN